MNGTKQTPEPPSPSEKEQAEGSEEIVDRELDRQKESGSTKNASS